MSAPHVYNFVDPAPAPPSHLDSPEEAQASGNMTRQALHVFILKPLMLNPAAAVFGNGRQRP